MIPPSVTIGMPVYNGGHFVKAALESLLAQTFTDFEIIISDNASTDQTQAICERVAHADARVRYIRQIQNAGGRDNFLATLAEASGKYFMWAAHDDIWAPSFIELLSQALEADEALAFAVPRATIVSMALGPVGRHLGSSLPMIELLDREARVMAFTKLPFDSHKDNMVYGLWRLECLRRVIGDLEHSDFGRQYLIGGPMNEYALSLYRGAYLGTTLFQKRYRMVAPGHPLSGAATAASNFQRFLTNRPRRTSNFGLAEYKTSLRLVLELANFDPAFISSAIASSLTARSTSKL